MLNFTKTEESAFKSYMGIREKPSKDETRLWEKVSSYNTLFSYIPGISCICVCNSLAMNATHVNSDIDLFIITKKNRLWTARIFMTLLLFLTGQRKTDKKHAGKFCLSFFISEESMSLKDIAIERDIYLSYWIQTLKPILNRNRCFQSFMEENLIQFSPPNTSILNPFPSEGKGATQDGTSSLLQERIERGVLGKLGNLLEYILKTLFLPRTKKSFQKLGKPFGVVISDTMLKFHNQDKRKKIRDTIIS